MLYRNNFKGFFYPKRLTVLRKIHVATENFFRSLKNKLRYLSKLASVEHLKVALIAVLMMSPPHEGKFKKLAACYSQTTSSLGYLNNNQL